MSGTLSTGTTAWTPSFDQIPYTIQRPGEYVEIKPVYNNLGPLPFPARALIIGQKIASAPGATLVINNNVQRPADATGAYGAGSQIDRMATAYFAANSTVPVDVVAVSPATGATAASGTITVSGAWTQAGTIAVGVSGVRVQAGFASTDSVTAVAADWVAAANAIPSLPVTAANVAGVITLTAKDPGLGGNAIRIKLNPAPGDTLPPGMTATVVAMSGGATDPDITTVWPVIAGTWYTDIVIAWSGAPNLAGFSAELVRRYGAMVRQDAHGYFGSSGSFGAALAIQAETNGQYMTFLPIRNPHSTPWETAASLAGVCAAKSLDDPARQLRGLALPGIVGPDPNDAFNSTEQELLLEGGCSTFGVHTDGTVVLQRVVTTYLTNSQGVADPAWHDIMTPKTATRVRYDWRTYFALTYPRNKLADDGSLAAEYDPTVCTPRRAAGSWAARYLVYAKAGWLESEEANIKAAVFARDVTDRNRLNAKQPIQIIGNQMILAAQIQFEV